MPFIVPQKCKRNKINIDVFLELSSFFHDPADVDNLISGSSAFSKTSLKSRSSMELGRYELLPLKPLRGCKVL